MVKYIGISKEQGDKWYMIIFMLYNRMIKITLYTPKYIKPKYYWYNEKTFKYLFNDKSKRFHFKWFFGLKLNDNDNDYED